MSKAYFVKQMSDGRYWWFEIDLNSEDWNPIRRKRNLLDWLGDWIGWFLNLI